MADHNKPTVTSLYANFVAELDARLDDLTLMLDPARTTATNIPTGAIRWASASSKWQLWNGSAWVDLAATYAINALTASSAAKWTTARTLALSGDVTGSTTIDGSANKTITATLSNTGVAAGTYRSVTVDAKGRVTGATNPTTLSGYGITDAVPAVDVAQVPAASKIVKATAAGPIDLGWLDTAVARELRMLAVGVNPSLDLDFGRQNYRRYNGAKGLEDLADPFASFITFTRSTIGTYIGADGLLKTAAINEPRIEYDPVSGECKGLLIEEQRANVATQSGVHASLENASVIDSAPFLDGSSSNIYMANASDAANRVVKSGLNGGNATSTVTASVFVKIPSTSDVVRLFFRLRSNASSGCGVAFGITNGVPAVSSAINPFGTNPPPAVDLSTAFVIPVGNGWYRIGFAAVSSSSEGFVHEKMDVGFSTIASSEVFVVTENTIIASTGWQLEAGSFPTSYIKTEASAVTRGADNASVTGANFSSWYRQDEGSVFIDYKLGYKLGASRSFVIHNATNNEFIDGVSGTGSNPLSGNGGGISAYSAGVYATSFLNEVNTVGKRYRLILAIKENDYGFSRNGAATLTDNDSPVPQALVRLAIGNNAAGSACMNGHISRLTYWPKRLTNTQLQELSK